MGDGEEGADGVGVEVVVEGKEGGSLVFENSGFYFGVSGVDDFDTQLLRLALQWKRRFARGAEVVYGDGVARSDVKPWRFAGGAEEVGCAPGFGADASALGGAFVAV